MSEKENKKSPFGDLMYRGGGMSPPALYPEHEAELTRLRNQIALLEKMVREAARLPCIKHTWPTEGPPRSLHLRDGKQVLIARNPDAPTDVWLEIRDTTILRDKKEGEDDGS